MRSNETNEREAGSTHRGCWHTPWVIVGALMPALVTAQSATTPQATSGPMVTVLRSAQYSIFGGHSMVLRVNDAGSPDAATEVTLELRDGSDVQKAFKSAVLRGRRSVELVLRLPPDANRTTLSGIVKMIPIANPELSAPFAILEDVNHSSFTIDWKPPCPMAADPEYGHGAEGDCGGGWRVSRLTLEQSSNSPD